MSKIVLGISGLYHDAAAALVVDGEIIAAAQEERYSRKKHDPRFPHNAINYCLEEAFIETDEIDAVVFYDSQILKLDRLLKSCMQRGARSLEQFDNAIRSLEAINFWNPENAIAQSDPHTASWSSITTGGCAGCIMTVDDALAGKLKLETARLLMYKLAWMLERGESVAMEAALLKLHLSETMLASSLDAIRVHGGMGYLTDAEIERDLRDAVGGVLYAGTSDIQRVLVARMLGGVPISVFNPPSSEPKARGINSLEGGRPDRAAIPTTTGSSKAATPMSFMNADMIPAVSMIIAIKRTSFLPATFITWLPILLATPVRARPALRMSTAPTVTTA